MWEPSANIATLKKRASIIADMRAFFAERNILEVETPQLGSSTATDPHIESFTVPWPDHSHRYLQTSPEFPMKRLLAAGCGDIYQISKVFRSGEQGRRHNPEFTLLEWYRTEFDHFQLMKEVDALLQCVLKTPEAEQVTYAELFEQYLGLNPHLSSAEALQKCAEKQNLDFPQNNHKDFWLHLLISHCIEPHLGQDQPVFVTDFPASQAALAKIRPDDPPVAERFEVFYKGVELGNGYHELTDAKEQRRRFETDNEQRLGMRLSPIPLDEYFLEALEHGMPPSAGVALGVDRLIMLALGAKSIAEVISFTADRV